MPKKRKKMSRAEFKEVYEKIQEEDWVESTRSGATAVGHTLESKLGLDEDNLAAPDLGFAELKAHREESSAMITLFTFDRDVWLMKPKEAISQFGTEDENKRKGLYFTLRNDGGVTKTGLSLFGDDESVSVIGPDDKVIAKWALEKLVQKFAQKMPKLVLVSAKSKMKPGKKGVVKEHFKFKKARLFSTPSVSKLRLALMNGLVCVDLRMHDAVSKVRNHGTAFRVREDALSELFETEEDL
jgi:hypothetical protein